MDNFDSKCACPKQSCPNWGNCKNCVIKHKVSDSLPFCLFKENNGDKSNKNYYQFLKKRYENKEN